MLRTHYRQPIDFTVKALEEAERTLANWVDAVVRGLDGEAAEGGKVCPDVLEALTDDLNTPQVLSELHRLAFKAKKGDLEAAQSLVASLALMGIALDLAPAALADVSGVDVAKIEDLIEARIDARHARNWAESDRIRDELAGLGVVLKDNKDGTTSWELKR